jgi:hypothetical protein
VGIHHPGLHRQFRVLPGHRPGTIPGLNFG